MSNLLSNKSKCWVVYLRLAAVRLLSSVLCRCSACWLRMCTLRRGRWIDDFRKRSCVKLSQLHNNIQIKLAAHLHCSYHTAQHGSAPLEFNDKATRGMPAPSSLAAVKPRMVWDSGTSLARLPHAGSRVVRIDLLRFLAGCRKRRINQALTVLSLSISFFECVLLFIRAIFVYTLYVFCPLVFG